jgi:hypothetical protein
MCPGCVLELLKLSSNVNEFKPLVCGGGVAAAAGAERGAGERAGRAPPVPGAGGGGGAHWGGRHGRPVQLDPIKPTLKAPGIERLKLNYDDPRNSFPGRKAVAAGADV